MATASISEIQSTHPAILRGHNEVALIQQGLNTIDRYAKMRDEHKMTLYYKFLNPENAKKFDRPVVDCSAPRNLGDERDHVRSENGMIYKGAMFAYNPSHMAGVQEPAPYVYTHHNFDFLIHSSIFTTSLFLNWYISRTQMGGSILGHPHTQWAHNIVFSAGMIRAFLATMIGVGGSLYTYEALYTHAPWFKINDPSTNGWGRTNEEGQTTYCARAVSMLWLPLGSAFFTGTFKRFHFNASVSVFAGVTYEFLRHFANGSDRMRMRNIYQRENGKQEATGSLGVNVNKQVDYATGLLPEELNTRFANASQSTLRELGWVENCFDNLPMSTYYRKERNHRYNWTFAKTATGERKYKYKNESWELPNLQLDARSHTDAFDKVKTPSFYERMAKTF